MNGNRRVRYLACAAAILMTLGVLALACDGGDEKEEGPPLPSAGTMTFDISAFQTEQQNQALEPGKADGVPGEKANFNNAAFRVWWLNTSIAAHLAVPAAVLGAALYSGATWDGVLWTWEFSVTANGQTYKAVLTGWFDNNLKEGVFLNLSMAITCTACKTPLDDYVWYTGRFKADGGSGHWQFFSPEIATEDQSLVRIDYEIVDEEHKTLVFTNNRNDGHEDAGDVITYSRDGDAALVSVHDESEALEYEARWSISTTAGSLTVPGYNNGEEACWDENHLNVACQ